MLALQHPPPPYHPPPPPTPPPRYTITVNVNTIRVLNLAQSGSLPRAVDEKNHLDHRQSRDTIPPSPTHLTACDYHDYHNSRRRDCYTMAKPTHRSAVPAPSIRSTVCRWFTRKPSTPCPKFQAFLFSVRCSRCAPHNDAHSPYGTKDLCTFQSGFNTRGGRKGYLVASAPDQHPTAAETKEQRRKIKNKFPRGMSADLGERVLRLDLCGMAQSARDANVVLGKWMVDSYVAVDLDAADLTRELVDVWGLERELEEKGVRFEWRTEVESPLLG